jgi:secondary thiamine-phosphate synthase enzyme
MHVSVVTETIKCRTSGDGDTIDVTGELAERIEASGLVSGVATLFVPGSTAGLTTIEYEPGAVADLNDVFDGVAPRDRDWRHHLRWGDHNGHSHVRAAILGPSLSVPFVDGSPTLGTWQQIVLVDFDDRPRRREIVVQLLGEQA